MAKKNRSKGVRIATKGRTQTDTNQKEAIAITQRLEELHRTALEVFSSMENDMTSIFKSAHAKEIEDLHKNLEEALKLLSDQVRLIKD